MPDLSLEKRANAQGYRRVCGIDEAGRGPWAGPVVAAAVCLDGVAHDETLIGALNDSKMLSAPRRKRLFEDLQMRADVSTGIASVEEIDELNILEATYLAMRRAVDGLIPLADYALIDGNRMPPLACEGETIVKGDGISASIAAASIVAKVTRDRMMAELAEEFPGYGWERNAGYGTAAHVEGLERFGVSPHHRRSFKPIRERLTNP